MLCPSNRIAVRVSGDVLAQTGSVLAVGHLAVSLLPTRSEVGQCILAGQPRLAYGHARYTSLHAVRLPRPGALHGKLLTDPSLVRKVKVDEWPPQVEYRTATMPGLLQVHAARARAARAQSSDTGGHSFKWR